MNSHKYLKNNHPRQLKPSVSTRKLITEFITNLSIANTPQIFYRYIVPCL